VRDILSLKPRRGQAMVWCRWWIVRIRMCRTAICCVGVEWIELDQDRLQGRALWTLRRTLEYHTVRKFIDMDDNY
jgi:hypothetical protein